MEYLNDDSSIIDEIYDAYQLGYLISNQINIFNARKNENLSYIELITRFIFSCICSLKYWNHGMANDGSSYLSSYDEDIFLRIIQNAADDQNCVPALYAQSLAYYIKKKEMTKHL